MKLGSPHPSWSSHCGAAMAAFVCARPRVRRVLHDTGYAGVCVSLLIGGCSQPQGVPSAPGTTAQHSTDGGTNCPPPTQPPPNSFPWLPDRMPYSDGGLGTQNPDPGVRTVILPPVYNRTAGVGIHVHCGPPRNTDGGVPVRGPVEHCALPAEAPSTRRMTQIDTGGYQLWEWLEPTGTTSYAWYIVGYLAVQTPNPSTADSPLELWALINGLYQDPSANYTWTNLYVQNLGSNYDPNNYKSTDTYCSGVNPFGGSTTNSCAFRDWIYSINADTNVLFENDPQSVYYDTLRDTIAQF